MLFQNEIIRFLLSGGIAASANFSSRFFFRMFFNYEFSVIFACCVGIFISFILNRAFTFKVTYLSISDTFMEFFRFILVSIVGIFLTTFVASLLFRNFTVVFHIDISSKPQESISHAIAIALVTIWSFIGHKYFSFKATASVNK